MIPIQHSSVQSMCHQDLSLSLPLSLSSPSTTPHPTPTEISMRSSIIGISHVIQSLYWLLQIYNGLGQCAMFYKIRFIGTSPLPSGSYFTNYKMGLITSPTYLVGRKRAGGIHRTFIWHTSPFYPCLDIKDLPFLALALNITLCRKFLYWVICCIPHFLKNLKW